MMTLKLRYLISSILFLPYITKIFLDWKETNGEVLSFADNTLFLYYSAKSGDDVKILCENYLKNVLNWFSH